MADVPIIREFKVVRKGILAKDMRISFKCPHCKASLLSTEEETGLVDNCPHCGRPFQLDSSAKKAFESRDKAAERAAERELQRQRDELLRAEEDRIKAAEEETRRKEEAERRASEEAEERRKRDLARQRQQQAAQVKQEAQQSLMQQKAEYRNRGVRTYPTLAWLCEACGTISTLHFLVSFIGVLTVWATSSSEGFKFFVTVGVAVETILVWLILSTIAAVINLAVNVAQDIERLLLFREAEAGKDWAK